MLKKKKTTDDTKDTEKKINTRCTRFNQTTHCASRLVHPVRPVIMTKKSVKSVKSVDKKVENNKSAFYSKINGFLFGSLKNNHYLCKQKETIL